MKKFEQKINPVNEKKNKYFKKSKSNQELKVKLEEFKLIKKKFFLVC